MRQDMWVQSACHCFVSSSERSEAQAVMLLRHPCSPWFSQCPGWGHLWVENLITSQCQGRCFVFCLAPLYLEPLGDLGRWVGPKRTEEISGHIFVTKSPSISLWGCFQLHLSLARSGCCFRGFLLFDGERKRVCPWDLVLPMGRGGLSHGA